MTPRFARTVPIFWLAEKPGPEGVGDDRDVGIIANTGHA
jgi:hypothetical protein